MSFGSDVIAAGGPDVGGALSCATAEGLSVRASGSAYMSSNGYSDSGLGEEENEGAGDEERRAWIRCASASGPGGSDEFSGLCTVSTVPAVSEVVPPAR